MNEKQTYCGFIDIVGRSNVGKSTLLNKLLRKKISITSCKKQTTRHRIIGIHTEGPYQAIYSDTPGIQIRQKITINNLEKRSAYDIGLVIFVVENTYWTLDDEILLNKLRNNAIPVVLVINKVDNMPKKEDLLPHIQWLSNQMCFLDIIPLSAKTGVNVDIITSIVHKHLPKGIHHFPEWYITDCSQCFIASEIIREKLMRFLGSELPYSTSVKIEQFRNNNHGSYDINGIIFVKRENQKKIVISKRGAKIKIIGIEARKDMQKVFGSQVHLQLWVKVRSKLDKDRSILHNLSY